MKIMFVGDIHISDKAPRNRKEEDEDYRHLILDKLNFCYSYCITNNIEYVIMLGDIFNSSINIYPPYLTEVYQVLQKFKDSRIEVYSIIGNHDMYYQNDSEFTKTTLYQAFTLGLIKHLDILEFPIGVRIVGVDYSKSFTKIESESQYNILVGHCFYENEMFGNNENGNLTHEKCLELGYNDYILGHDHTYYPTVNMTEYRVIRPGSLLRGTSKTCNLYRNVVVDVFDTMSKTWEEVIVPTKPGIEVFNEKVVLTKQEDLDLNLENIIANLDYSTTSNEYDIIDKNEDNGRKELGENYDEVINLITHYLEVEGIYREMKNED